MVQLGWRHNSTKVQPVWLKHGSMGWVLQNAIFQFTFKKCRNGELLYMKNLSVFILARKILFCSIIFPHSHKRTRPSTPTAPVRFVYGYRREGEGSRGSWKLYMLKKGQVFLLLKKRGYSPQSITVPTWSKKNVEKCIRDIQNHLLSISLIVIKYKILHYTEVPRININ